VVELARALKADGRVEPVVVVPVRGEVSRTLESCSVECRFESAPTWLVDESPPLPSDPFRFVRRAKRVTLAATASSRWLSLLREIGPDVVMSSTTTSPTPAVASRRAGIPHVWWVHEFTTLDHHKVYALGEHASQTIIGRLSRAVAVNSRAVADHYAPPIDREKVQLVELGIEPEPVEPLDAVVGRVRLLFLGRKAPGKGCETAVRAMGELAGDGLDVTLRMTGPSVPGYAMTLWNLANDLGVVDRIAFLEYATEPRKQFAWSDAVLMCSYNEGFGRVTIEALKSGRPVIAARGGATTELVVDGTNGLLFEPGDASGLAAAVRRCARDASLLSNLATNAAAGTRDRFTLQGEVDTFVDLFHDVKRRSQPLAVDACP
jgi:glycosyltransferase involved in cell wall biosynthesis